MRFQDQDSLDDASEMYDILKRNVEEDLNTVVALDRDLRELMPLLTLAKSVLDQLNRSLDKISFLSDEAFVAQVNIFWNKYDSYLGGIYHLESFFDKDLFEDALEVLKKFRRI